MAVPTKNDIIEALFEYGMDIKNRKVFLHSPMDSAGESDKPGPIERAIRGLLYLDQDKNDKPIELWINTPGGDVAEMFGLYDVIQTLNNEVDTIGFGEVASAGGLILACGKTRFATSNCFFMAHAMSLDPGRADVYTSEAAVNIAKKYQERWADLMEKHTKHIKKWWLDGIKGVRREIWLDSKEMLQCGIVDEIWENE